jgi:hypothetical protein
MLQQQQRVVDLTGDATFVKPDLQSGSVRVSDLTQPFDG